MYQPRTYRHRIEGKDLISFNVVVEETDLYIRASTNLRRKAYRAVLKYRNILESYIEQHPSFLTSLEPLHINNNAPRMVKQMAEKAERVGVGPMAAVAGAMAQFTAEAALRASEHRYRKLMAPGVQK